MFGPGVMVFDAGKSGQEIVGQVFEGNSWALGPETLCYVAPFCFNGVSLFCGTLSQDVKAMVFVERMPVQEAERLRFGAKIWLPGLKAQVFDA